MAKTDPRQTAFDALLPLAKPTAAALERVDAAVENERKMSQLLRERWTPTQHAAAQGLARFNYGVDELGLAWETNEQVLRRSTPTQELGQIFLWTLGPEYVLRVKHEPVEGVAPGTQRLFEQMQTEAGETQIFLTWGISNAGRIVNPMFVSVQEPTFTIRLSQLLEAASADVTTVTARKPSPKVRSSRAKRTEQRDES